MDLTFKKKIFLISTATAFLWLLGSIFINSIKYNVHSNDSNTRKLYQYVIPQGWGFFTKSPRGEMVDLYKVHDDKSMEIVPIRNNHHSYYFGMSRESRKIGMEISVLLSQVNDKKWDQFKGFENICIPDSSFVVSNASTDLIPDGNYMLVKYKETPWSWRNTVKDSHIPYETIYINCSNI